MNVLLWSVLLLGLTNQLLLVSSAASLYGLSCSNAIDSADNFGCTINDACGCGADQRLTISGTGFPLSGTVTSIIMVSPVGRIYNLPWRSTGQAGNKFTVVTILPAVQWYETQDTQSGGRFRVQIAINGAWTNLLPNLQYGMMSAPAGSSPVVYSFTNCLWDCDSGVGVAMRGSNLPFTEPPVILGGVTQYSCSLLDSSSTIIRCYLPAIDTDDIGKTLRIYPSLNGAPVSAGASIMYQSSSRPTSVPPPPPITSTGTSQPPISGPRPILSVIQGCTNTEGPIAGTGDCKGNEIITMMGSFFCPGAVVQMHADRSSEFLLCLNYQMISIFQATCRLPIPTDGMRGTTLYVSMSCESTGTSDEFAGITYAKVSSSHSNFSAGLIAGVSVTVVICVVLLVVITVIGLRYHRLRSISITGQLDVWSNLEPNNNSDGIDSCYAHEKVSSFSSNQSM